MQNTVDGILAALDTAYTTDSAAAAALGLSRQAYSLIKQRRALSDAVCIRAAELLGLDPAETLIRLQIDRANTPETRATYEKALSPLIVVLVVLLSFMQKRSINSKAFGTTNT